jgi:6-pyruvoyltetrahydropterin/6-carboxytetrahydropterin synthase
MIVTIKRKAQFNAAHRLHVPSWTEEENVSFFGKCNRTNYHGHNYKLQVHLTGEINKESGYLFDLGILREIIEEEVIEPFDHKNLNLDCLEFKDRNPTAEYIAIVIWEKLRLKIENKIQIGVHLSETENNSVEYYGK